MAKVSFDPVTKLITVTEAPTGGVVTLDAQKELYSEAKLQWKTDLNLNKYRFLFRDSFGGQDIGGGKVAGAYYFLDNAAGWRIKPFEADHELVVEGNLFGNNSLDPVFVPTVGAYTVLMRLNTSSLTQGILTGSGLSAGESQQLQEIHEMTGRNNTVFIPPSDGKITVDGVDKIDVTGNCTIGYTMTPTP